MTARTTPSGDRHGERAAHPVRAEHAARAEHPEPSDQGAGFTDHAGDGR
ncbi:hypothetical protein AB0C76_03455 [Kitasatospora sp. NPDC048722]